MQCFLLRPRPFLKAILRPAGPREAPRLKNHLGMQNFAPLVWAEAFCAFYYFKARWACSNTLRHVGFIAICVKTTFIDPTLVPPRCSVVSQQRRKIVKGSASESIIISSRAAGEPLQSALHVPVRPLWKVNKEVFHLQSLACVCCRVSLCVFVRCWENESSRRFGNFLIFVVEIRFLIEQSILIFFYSGRVCSQLSRYYTFRYNFIYIT